MNAGWWRAAVIYQVYPRSFQDTDGDGVGDLAGIERRLDYLVALGVDALWISPLYPSPMVDFGYDVADYTGVDPLFGTMADFDSLLAAAHARGLRLLLDFVPNHSSDRHPWFVESRSSRENPKRDWYIWRDPAPGADGSWGPPNNWISDFGGPAWEYDAATGQYYYHAMLREQPDLNWRDPGLRAAMFDAMRFWLDKGVDGFRIDILWHMVKAAGFPDNPPNPDWGPGMADMARVLQTNSTDQPEVHGLAAEMRALADRYGERLLVGEIYLPLERLMAYYGTADAPEVQLPFNFELVTAGWDAATLRDLIVRYEALLPAGAWPNWVLGNHDRPRIATRVGEAQARVAAMLLLTLRGTPTLYYGDELGLADVDIPADRIGVRTGSRPKPWDQSPDAGFTTGTPWLPLNPDWPTRNVATQAADPSSMLNLHRALLALRRAHPALALGDIRLLDGKGDVLAYERVHEDERLLIALNLGAKPTEIALPEGSWQHLLSTLPCSREGRGPELQAPPSATLGSCLRRSTAPLAPNEALLLLKVPA